MDITRRFFAGLVGGAVASAKRDLSCNPAFIRRELSIAVLAEKKFRDANLRMERTLSHDIYNPNFSLFR
jgi:hypothetical protein